MPPPNEIFLVMIEKYFSIGTNLLTPLQIKNKIHPCHLLSRAFSAEATLPLLVVIVKKKL